MVSRATDGTLVCSKIGGAPPRELSLRFLIFRSGTPDILWVGSVVVALGLKTSLTLLRTLPAISLVSQIPKSEI